MCLHLRATTCRTCNGQSLEPSRRRRDVCETGPAGGLSLQQVTSLPVLTSNTHTLKNYLQEFLPNDAPTIHTGIRSRWNH